MAARVIDGLAVAKQVRAEYRERVDSLKRLGVTPGLAVILVGENPASKVYVKNKVRACTEVGLQSQVYRFSATTPEAVVLREIERLNADPTIHGILVQLPLPPHFQIRTMLEAISCDKDVDGFHLYNVGGLVVGDTVFPPCTPYGVHRLLESENIKIAGQNVVVVGASNIVGKPMALMLMQKEATVAICHAKTRDLAQFTILADILVVAAGKPNLILPQMVKTGAVVIDVGINRLPDGRLVGDVDFEGVKPKASYITPRARRGRADDGDDARRQHSAIGRTRCRAQGNARGGRPGDRSHELQLKNINGGLTELTDTRRATSVWTRPGPSSPITIGTQ